VQFEINIIQGGTKNWAIGHLNQEGLAIFTQLTVTVLLKG